MPPALFGPRARSGALAICAAISPIGRAPAAHPSFHAADVPGPTGRRFAGGSARERAPTTVVVLGVDHSAQLAGHAYHPGYLRAFFDRLRPDALCIEQPPEEFARNVFYFEAAYEQPYVAVPYARRHGIELCPVDWIPSRDDERLAFGRTEVVDPPPIRAPRDFQGFLVLDSAALRHTLFYADSDAWRGVARQFFDGPRRPGWSDFPRRLDLYRTFMQAMRVRAAARAHPGQTVLVVIGAMHKADIEGVLAGDPDVRVVQPSTYGLPAAADADAQLEVADLAAILSFNLLGVQPLEGPVDWPWVGEILDRYARARPTAPELPLLRARYAVLTRHESPAAAATRFEQIALAADTAARFAFTGVEDGRRLDSYYDPFGNLGVRQRALVEAAREWARAGRPADAERARGALLRGGAWSPLRRAQLVVYWERYIAPSAPSGAAGAM